MCAVVTAGCAARDAARRIAVSAAQPPPTYAGLRRSTVHANTLAPPPGAVAAERALGPFASIGDLCDALLDDCDPREGAYSCSGPRELSKSSDTAPSRAGWVYVEAPSQVVCPSFNGHDGTIRPLISTKRGLWVTRVGVPAGTMWATNGDGFHRHSVVERSVHVADDERVHCDARVEVEVWWCCHSGHPSCAGIKGKPRPGGYMDYVVECRPDRDGTPWCVVTGIAVTDTGPAAAGPAQLRVAGGDLEAHYIGQSGPVVKRRPLWFPP
jgi:hypothetical protein